MLIHKLQEVYTVLSDGCIVDKFKTIITPDIQYLSTIHSWVKNMVLSLTDNIITIKLWLCITIAPTVILISTLVFILCPWCQYILVKLIISDAIWNLVTFRRQYFCAVELWSVFIHILDSFYEHNTTLDPTYVCWCPPVSSVTWVDWGGGSLYWYGRKTRDNWWLSWPPHKDYSSALSARSQYHANFTSVVPCMLCSWIIGKKNNK